MNQNPPISQYSPEEIFASAPACEVARTIRRDEPAQVSQLLTRHPELDPNKAGARGLTLLFWAYAHGCFACLRPLVDHGADPSRRLTITDSQGDVIATHLVNLAAVDPDDEALTALLLLGASASSKNERGESALHSVVLAENYPRMRQLLDHGADVDATDRSGATIITLLARRGHFEQVYYLLQQGADFRKPDNEVARLTQETDADDEASTAWQIRVKQKLAARGVSFPVPRPGAARYAAVQAQWEQTLEGRDWRVRLREFGAPPEVVGRQWVEEADRAFAALQAWMALRGLPEPPL